jgi:hypothetical protein
MNFTCPHCSQGYTLGETHYRGGQIFACGPPCNRQSVIPLYCPQCCPPNVAAKTWLVTPNEDLEGRLFSCSRGHSFRVSVTREAAHARLQRLGTEVGQYHQSDRIQTLTDSTTRTAVSGGYCSGACYDWIRRVLVSSTPKFTYRNLESAMSGVAQGQRTAEMNKQHRQDHRAAQMQRQDINPLLRTKSQALIDKLNADLSLAHQNYSRENDRINAMPGTRQVKQPLWDENTRIYNETCASLQRAYDMKVAAPPVEKVWAEFRRKMDEAIEYQRRRLGKTTATSARPFENLDLVVRIARPNIEARV